LLILPQTPQTTLNSGPISKATIFSQLDPKRSLHIEFRVSTSTGSVPKRVTFFFRDAKNELTPRLKTYPCQKKKKKLKKGTLFPYLLLISILKYRAAEYDFRKVGEGNWYKRKT
jgi:hypothetical protein